MNRAIARPPPFPAFPPDNGVDDTDSLQRVLDRNNGGTVTVPLGTYIVTALTFPSNGITLVGEGPGSIIQQKAATDSHMLVSTGTSALVQLFDLTIDGNQANNTNDLSHQYIGLKFQSYGAVGAPARLVIRGCRFINGRNSDISVFALDSATVKTYVEIKDNYFLGGCEGARYIYCQNTVDATVEGNTFDFNRIPTDVGRAGPSFDSGGALPSGWTNAGTVTIANNTLYNCGVFGAVMLGAIECYSGYSNVTITGNRLHQPYGRGINVKTDSSGVTITGNVVIGLNDTVANPGMTAQIIINSAINNHLGDGFVVSGNVCIDSGQDGISVTGNNTTTTDFARNRVVANNVVVDAVRRCIGVLNCNNIEIIGNATYGGVNGLWVSPTRERVTISGNTFEASTSPLVQIQGGTDPVASSNDCDVFVIGNTFINGSGVRGLYCRYVGDCTVLDNRFDLDGLPPITLLDVIGTRLVKNNSIKSNTANSLTDATNTGPLITDFLVAVSGDAKITPVSLRATTTSTASKRLTSAGAAASTSNTLNLANNSALMLDISLIVRDSAADVASFQSLGVLIKRGANAAATALVGSPVFTALFKSAGFASIVEPTIAADTTNGGLNISVVALGTNTTNWVASVKVTEVQ